MLVAATVNEYVVPAVKPVAEKVAVEVVPTATPSRNTEYPVAPEEGAQVMVASVAVTPDDASPVGAAGAFGNVVTTNTAEAPDVPPGLTALTVYE